MYFSDQDQVHSRALAKPRPMPDRANDLIGLRLAKICKNQTWTREKRVGMERLYNILVLSGYVGFWGQSRRFGLTRVGMSCRYLVPETECGALGAFRGQYVRVVCVVNGRDGPFLMAGRLV
jgi:hypothetical protein